MKHKGLLFIVTALVVLSSYAAYADGAKIGMISQAQATAEEVSKTAEQTKNLVLWEVNENRADAPDIYRFYDNLAAMLLAVEVGEIDGMFLTRPVAEYLTAQNPSLKIYGIAGMAVDLGYAFGFMNDDKGKVLCNKFNEALRIIKQVGRLDKLYAKYLVKPGRKDPEVVNFPLFPDGETIKVAVTGDLPPLDYMTPDGKAAGFNTALLAEIGKHLGCSIEIMQVDSAARVPALTSGRADVVFWFSVWTGIDTQQPDMTSDVIVSEPYYTTDMFFRVGKK